MDEYTNPTPEPENTTAPDFPAAPLGAPAPPIPYYVPAEAEDFLPKEPAPEAAPPAEEPQALQEALSVDTEAAPAPPIYPPVPAPNAVYPPLPPQMQGYAPPPPPGYPQYPQAAAPWQNPAQPPVKKKHKGLTVLAVLICLTLIVTGIVVIVSLLNNGSDNLGGTGDGTTLNIAPTPTEKLNLPASGSVLTSEQISEKLSKSVVGIVLFSGRKGDSAVGSASGIIMGEDSTGKYTYVITCAHVISDGGGLTVKVQFENGSQEKAEIVGYDTRTDLGVIRIKKTGLQAAEFGNSDAIRAGEQIWAIGNPAGMEFYGSITTGIVSAIGRDLKSENETPLIQHDAAINPGNSGGPLVNKYGQVIGIVSMKLVSGDIEGMGFAIPSTPAKLIIDELIKNGKISGRARLGIYYSEASQSAKYSMVIQLKKLPSGSLIIEDIDPSTPLAKTKAQKYDMIVAVNGKKLDKPDVLLDVIQKGKPGQSITLDLVRVFSDYSIEEFSVKTTLVEDTGETGYPEESTEPEILLPF